MFENLLYVRKITDHLDKNGKGYFNLIVSEISSCIPPAPWDDQCHLFHSEREHILTVFKNSGYAQVYYFVNIDADDPITGCPGVKQPINLTGDFYDLEAAYVVVEKVHLYAALDAGDICEGYWFCGEIIARRVQPYTLNGKTAKHYTLPMLWDELRLTDEQKENKIAREFNWKGRPLAKGTAKDWAKEDEEEERDKHYVSSWAHVTNADAFDDPSDYWNID